MDPPGGFLESCYKRCDECRVWFLFIVRNEKIVVELGISLISTSHQGGPRLFKVLFWLGNLIVGKFLYGWVEEIEFKQHKCLQRSWTPPKASNNV